MYKSNYNVVQKMMCAVKGVQSVLGVLKIERLLLQRATQGKLSGMVELELVLKAEYMVLAQAVVQDIVPD